MVEWQANLTKTLQKADPNGNVTTSNANPESNHHEMTNEKANLQEHTFNITKTNGVDIVKGAATLGNKSYSPNILTIKPGNTVTWTNMDDNMHTVTSGKPNTVNAGELFDSGLTALIMPSKSFSHKFMHPGEFPYFCRVHPTMTGEVRVLP
jgi:nitrite reductase (NO-forming)